MWFLAFVIIAFSIYWHLSNKLKYWERLGVKSRTPNIFFGNIFQALTLKESVGQLHTSLYRQFRDVPYVGYYIMSRPGLLIRDAELVKNVMIKDFDSFAKNDIDVDVSVDPLFARNPFVLHGEAWKHTRNLLTPAFSSGKMKLMFPLMEEVTKNLNNYISRKIQYSVEAKDLCARFTVDNVATCAFGLEASSFTEKEGQFKEMGQKIFNFDSITGLKMMIAFLYPTLSKLLKIRFIPKESSDYFTSIVSQTMAHRAKNNLQRNDFLDMMAQLKIKHGTKFSDIDVTAHAIGFFVDGYETSATTMSFALYCIAKYSDVQTKLRKHIERVLAQFGGNFCYEAAQEMNYLEMVILESMRQFPPLLALTKKCTKTYQLTPELTVQSDTSIIIPVYGLHNDERYFENAQKYDPDRFSDGNKQSVEKGSFLPFGEGPRQCLGQRFGLLQVKVAIVSIVREFRISVSQKTIEPIQFETKSLLTAPIGGLWLNYEKI